MVFLGVIFRFLLIAGAALLGNYVGDFLAQPPRGRSAPDLGLGQPAAAHASAISLQIRLTNFVPAVVLALLAGPPRVVYAFVSGALLSMLVGDRYESAA